MEREAAGLASTDGAPDITVTAATLADLAGIDPTPEADLAQALHELTKDR